MKTANAFGSFLLILLLLPAIPALAATTHKASPVPLAGNPIGTCPLQTFLTAPPKPRLLLLSITWTAKNDEDSGITGYWALDHFKETLKVWALPGGIFYAEKIYTGVFSTPLGAISPGTAASAEGESAFGTIQGGYVATFTGEFTPGSNPVTGNIGTFNYGGTIQDVLLGSYGNGQVGDATPYSWEAAYFTNVNGFALNHWGWAYLLNSVFHSTGSINQWCNYNAGDGGNSGDILVP